MPAIEGATESFEKLKASPFPECDGDLQLPREAAGTLLWQLTPQERAAVVLKEVFDFSLEEIGAALSTTPNAVKAALHRGRGKLGSDEVVEAASPPPAVLNEFCAAFNARDIPKLTALLLDTTTSEMVGAATQYGRVNPTHSKYGMLKGMFGAYSGVDPRYREDYLPEPARAEVRAHRAGHVVLIWCKHTSGEAVRGIIRIQAAARVLLDRRHYRRSLPRAAGALPPERLPLLGAHLAAFGALTPLENPSRCHPSGVGSVVAALAVGDRGEPPASRGD